MSVDNSDTSLAEFLREEWKILLNIKPRLTMCIAFDKELKAVTRGKPFAIRNERFWNMFLDHRDVLVIDLCSWAASIYSGETRLNELKERHCSELARQRRWGTGDGEWIEQHYDRSHSEAFARLFPGISGETPSQSDVEALRSRLQKYYKPLHRDRNHNRAHRYENRNHPARAAMLDFERLWEFFEFSRQLIVDLRLVADGSQLGFDDVSPTRAEFVSPDIVDLVLLGSIEERQSLIGTESRADFYARLHAAHEAAGEADLAFNDGRFLYPDG